MNCLECLGTDFEIQKIRLSFKIKNQSVEVVLPCSVCRSCSRPLMEAAQMNILRQAASDVYREKNGLLTSKQIIKYRERLKMSQTAFAHYLSVGEASVKRWESYHIQDCSQDDHIRIKCDIVAAQNNHAFLLSGGEDPNIYNGNRQFSSDFTDNIRLYLNYNVSPQNISCINKLHFYIDFLHFKNYGRSITGCKYVPLKYGPCPFISDLFTASKLEDHRRSCTLDLFDDQEQNTINRVCELYIGIGEKNFSEMTRKEKGYLDTNEPDFISYKYAKDLLI